MIKQYTRGEILETDPKDYPITRPMARFINRVINEGSSSRFRYRQAVGVRVLAEIPGTVARWVPEHNEVDLARTIMEAADPTALGTEEDIRRNPEMYGPIIHEVLHVLFSHLDLRKASKNVTPRELNAIKLLEEGRIEVQGLSTMPDLYLDALRAGLMSYVFVDLLSLEEGEKDWLDQIDEDGQRAYQSVQVMAMMYLRYQHKVMDPELESGKNLIEKLKENIGPDFYLKFAELAERFSKISFDYWSQDEVTAYEIGREWVKLEDELLREHGYEPEEEPGDGDGEPGDGEPGDGDAGDGDGDDDGDGEETTKTGGQTDESHEGNRSGTKYSGDRTGESSDGKEELESSAEEFGAGGLGSYGSSRKVGGDKPIDLMRGLLNEVDKEIKQIAGQRLKADMAVTLKKIDNLDRIRADHKRKARDAWKRMGNR